ncbi:MAG: pyruvate dehydrogenase E1 [Chloroflexi bacterium AL-W]|nr:pyruvate dehydrogenase E1 [Chloroflexi bacterium AL-N1]NOK69623.1 pyruvate dehydrogenase E1 [Chloroflexi bacterium AL-N10]NOK72170.1 pyruvate dehydrogenase E1 [Chloroflexi bacterium AL-N5]NOK84999.1 pyruvate dehydrogenase E1 [Chloroflexi bacterium AL-W]NOK91752.1 pyruvate dehydrogenase E1 [Chloroflexi bacterium AL-N15]
MITPTQRDIIDEQSIKNGSAFQPPAISPEKLAAMESVQQRLLWLSTLIIHHANNVRPNPDGTKVGGHQASSASTVSILTALYFHFLEAGDRVSIKPHAAPVFHAIQYLLGRLPRSYLTELRAYGGLQAYPSRTKDYAEIDFSTGSVGLGAVAPAFAALTQQYAQHHFGHVTSQRYIALIGDAELDEGNVWEAILDEALDGINNVLWIVDLNRQSLDRVVPGIRAARLKRLFANNGWNVLEAKYGRKLQRLFARSGGEALRCRIDNMDNEEYQAMIRLPGAEVRQRLCEVEGVTSTAIVETISIVPDEDLPQLLANLGGHDLEELLAVFAQADAVRDRPNVVFAYTIKGWGLPFAGHPLNHSMLLSDEQIEEVRQSFEVAQGAEWDGFEHESAAGQLCREVAEYLYPPQPSPNTLNAQSIPDDLSIPTSGVPSTQETFGRLLVRLADIPELRDRIVTTSPDVSVSTNLAGWINKMGVFALQEEPNYDTEGYRILKWKRGPQGQHIELGISEMNLFMLLGMLGLSTELCGQQIIPIGTVYDPFICRGLDSLIYGLYSGSRFIFAGTPSGITLAPEGGAHQSTVTPSLGMELPGLHFYEPCFARELNWMLLEALRECCNDTDGRATYLRLSTKPIDQSLLAPALQRIGEAELQRQVLAGGYRLVDWRDANTNLDPQYAIQIATSGAMVPEAVAAAELLHREGVAANVLNITSPRRLFEHWQATRNASSVERDTSFAWLMPPEERHVPIITVHDAASHTLAWLGSIAGAPVTALGVDAFGQSGTRADLYRHFGMDAEHIAEAAFTVFD